jgi:hypothetical protein
VCANPFEGTLEIDREAFRGETVVIASGFLEDPIRDYGRSDTVIQMWCGRNITEGSKVRSESFEPVRQAPNFVK